MILLIKKGKILFLINKIKISVDSFKEAQENLMEKLNKKIDFNENGSDCGED